MDIQQIWSFAASLWVVWFFVLFIGIIVWAFWPKRRKQLEDHAQIPLRDDK
jgi:cytochrome c oxidase cbb3-type subunit IV